MNKAYFCWSPYSQSASVSYGDSDTSYDLKLTRYDIFEIDLDCYLGEANFVQDFEVGEKKEKLLKEFFGVDSILDIDDDDDDFDLDEKKEELWKEFLSQEDCEERWKNYPDTSWQSWWKLEYYTNIDNEHDFLMKILDDLAPSAGRTELLLEQGYVKIDVNCYKDDSYVVSFDNFGEVEFDSELVSFDDIHCEIDSDYDDIDDYKMTSLAYNDYTLVSFYVKDEKKAYDDILLFFQKISQTT